MGWNGDYSSNLAVADEFRNDYEFNKRYELIDEKILKTYGLILYKNRETSEHIVDYWIFKDDMYKTISRSSNIIDCYTKVPKKWIKFIDKKRAKEAKDYHEKEKIKRDQSKNKLDDMLVPGQVYEIYDVVATYKYKLKRSHIFDVDGQLTRFTKLHHSDVKASKV